MQRKDGTCPYPLFPVLDSNSKADELELGTSPEAFFGLSWIPRIQAEFPIKGEHTTGAEATNKPDLLNLVGKCIYDPEIRI